MDHLDIQQMGDSPELDKIKEKVFGKGFKLPSENISALPSTKKRNLHTFVSARQELEKDMVRI